MDEFERIAGIGAKEKFFEKWLSLLEVFGQPDGTVKDDLEALYNLERKVQSRKRKKGLPKSIIKLITVCATCVCRNY